jgi:hypothetical protein
MPRRDQILHNSVLRNYYFICETLESSLHIVRLKGKMSFFFVAIDFETVCIETRVKNS